MGSTRFGGSASRRKPFWIYRTQGKHQRAIQGYDEAIQRHPNDFAAYQGRAAARESLGDKAGAAADLERVEELKAAH